MEDKSTRRILSHADFTTSAVHCTNFDHATRQRLVLSISAVWNTFVLTSAALICRARR